MPGKAVFLRFKSLYPVFGILPSKRLVMRNACKQSDTERVKCLLVFPNNITKFSR